MKKIIITICMFLVLAGGSEALAKGRFAMGPDAGFLYQMNRDSTGKRLEGSPGFGFGVSGVYEFGGDLSNIAVDYAVGVGLTSTIISRGVTIEGATGTYREKLLLIYWMLGGRYYFLNDKWRPYAGLDFGFNYFRRNGISYRDQFNNTLPTPSVSNNFNFALIPQVGIEYRPNFRWAFGLGVKPTIAFRSSGMVPGVFIPFTVHIAF